MSPRDPGLVRIEAWTSAAQADWARCIAEVLPNEALPAARLIQQIVLDPNFCPALAPVARDPAGQVVGFAVGWHRQVPLENAADDRDRGYITLFGVGEADRGQGIGVRLFAHIEAELVQLNVKKLSLSPYAPGYITPGVDEDRYPTAGSFLIRRGYVRGPEALAMEVPLWQVPDPSWIADRVTGDPAIIEPWSARFAWDLLEFARAEFGGDWVRWVREAMADITNGDDPNRLVLAHEGGRILGFSHFRRERFGPIGVAESARGRGLGHRLTHTTLVGQRDAGFRTAWFLWSEERTAERLYHAFGFQTIRKFRIYSKELSI